MSSERWDEIRTAAQNKKLHAMIRDIAEQVEWAGAKMDEKEWKLVLLAAMYEQEVIPNPFGPSRGFIVRNKRRSSGLAIPEAADFITEIEVFGDEQGVVWRDQQRAAA